MSLDVWLECMYTMCLSGADEGQEMPAILGLELETAGTPMWELWGKPESSVKATSAFNYWAVSLAPILEVFLSIQFSCRKYKEVERL